MLVASVDGLEHKGMNPSDAPVCPFWTFGALSQVVLAGELLNKLCGLIVWKSVSLVGDGRFVLSAQRVAAHVTMLRIDSCVCASVLRVWHVGVWRLGQFQVRFSPYVTHR